MQCLTPLFRDQLKAFAQGPVVGLGVNYPANQRDDVRLRISAFASTGKLHQLRLLIQFSCRYSAGAVRSTATLYGPAIDDVPRYPVDCITLPE